jgi:hypothetical protein
LNMALTTRRQFVRRTAVAAAALCGCPVTAFAGLRRTAEGTDQNVTPVEMPAIRKLVSQIRGHVIMPESPDYDSSRLVFNRAFDRHPALIVRCADSSDIALVLEFAQKKNLPLAVRGGGHNRAGFSVCDDGVVIDLSAMTELKLMQTSVWLGQRQARWCGTWTGRRSESDWPRRRVVARP